MQSNLMNATPTIKEVMVYERRDFNYIVLGGATLAMCAGFVNIVSILHCTITVSHNTGITSKMAISLARTEIPMFLYYASIVAAYLLGSTIVGFISQKEKFHYSRKYGFFLMGESLLLFITTYLFKNNQNGSGTIVASLALGVQNALFTNFSGAVVRTTHVTGLLTDIGLILGHRLRGREETKDMWRLKVLLPLFVGFVTGGCLATWSMDVFGLSCLYIPIFILGVGGLVWTVWRLKYQSSLFNKELTEKF